MSYRHTVEIDEESGGADEEDDEYRQRVIDAYEQELADKRSMQQAMREAEIALMPAAERYVFACDRMASRQRKWEKELQRMLTQYRQVVQSCPLPYHQRQQQYIEHNFPYLILPRNVGSGVIQHVATTVAQQCQRKYGSNEHVRALLRDVNALWTNAVLQYFGLSDNSVPHPDVLPCIVPNVVV